VLHGAPSWYAGEVVGCSATWAVAPVILSEIAINPEISMASSTDTANRRPRLSLDLIWRGAVLQKFALEFFRIVPLNLLNDERCKEAQCET